MGTMPVDAAVSALTSPLPLLKLSTAKKGAAEFGGATAAEVEGAAPLLPVELGEINEVEVAWVLPHDEVEVAIHGLRETAPGDTGGSLRLVADASSDDERKKSSLPCRWRAATMPLGGGVRMCSD